MKLNAKQMANHLSRIHIRGEIESVVLWGQFQGVARNKEGCLHAWLPPLHGQDPLPEKIVMPNVGLLIKVLRHHERDEALAAKRAGRDPRPIDFTLSPTHLILAGNSASKSPLTHRLKRATAQPTATRFGLEDVRAILQLLGDGSPPVILPASGLWLSRPVWKDGALPKPGAAAKLLSIVKAYRAKRVSLTIRPTRGEFALCGAPSVGSPFCRMPHGLRAPEAYELEFEARMFASVLVHVRRSPSMRIHLSGLEGPVLFADDDGCSYLVSQNWTPFTVREELRRPESAA